MMPPVPITMREPVADVTLQTSTGAPLPVPKVRQDSLPAYSAMAPGGNAWVPVAALLLLL